MLDPTFIDHPLIPITLYDYKGIKVIGMQYPDGTVIKSAPSKVGLTYYDDGVMFEVVWDGASDKMLLGGYETTGKLWQAIAKGEGWIRKSNSKRKRDANYE